MVINGVPVGRSREKLFEKERQPGRGVPQAQRDAMRKELDRNRGVAGRMGVEDPGGADEAVMAAQGFAEPRRGIALSPRSFMAGSNQGDRPESLIRSAPGNMRGSVASLWGDPVNSAHFDRPVTGLASGSLLDVWGKDGHRGGKGGTMPLGRPAASTASHLRGAGYDPSLTGDDYAGSREELPVSPAGYARSRAASWSRFGAVAQDRMIDMFNSINSMDAYDQFA